MQRNPLRFFLAMISLICTLGERLASDIGNFLTYFHIINFNKNLTIPLTLR
jgi:hypothetical protein